MSEGVRQGLGQVGLSGQKVELLRALRLALDTPDAEERYLAGERIFASARWELVFAESERVGGHCTEQEHIPVKLSSKKD